jgi:hypothetical protein
MHSGDVRVQVCAAVAQRALTEGSEPVYSGEGPVTRRGTVCSFASHGLTTEGIGAAQRLRRYEGGDAFAMALAAGDCPPPHAPDVAPAYITTYDTSPAAFVSIMQLWSGVAASPAALEHELACCDLGRAQPGAVPAPAAAAEIRQRLRTAVAAGEMRKAVVTRIVRIPGSAFRHRYALFVTDPQRNPAAPGFYLIYLRRDLRGPTHIIGIAETE